MKTYIVRVNGDVATVANLSEEDGDRLRQFVLDRSDALIQVRFSEHEVSTAVINAKAEVEQAIEDWRL